MWITPAEVAVLIGYNSFTNNTNPSIGQVQNVIDLIESEIRIKLLQNNLVVVGEDMTNVLKKYIGFGVASIILTSYLNNNQTEGSQASYYKQEYSNFISNMKKYFIKKNLEPSNNYTDGTNRREWWKQE